jgi:hypothetical protein
MVDLDSVEEIKAEMDEIRASLPAHSIPPSVLIRLEELEEQLESILENEEGERDAAA